MMGSSSTSSKLASRMTNDQIDKVVSDLNEYFLLSNSSVNKTSLFTNDLTDLSMYQKRAQILQPKLKYKFKNIILLHEALTHSLDTDGRHRVQLEGSQVSFKKRTNYRLKTLGVSVLKMVSCEYALFVCHADKRTTEGTLTNLCQDLTNNEVLKNVGKYLNLKEFVEVNQTCLKSKNFKIESIYPDLVRSIFASIFIDSTRGIVEHGLQSTFMIFIFIWKALNIFKEKSALLEQLGHREFEDFFPGPPKPSTADLLRKRFSSTPGYMVNELDNLEKCLFHKFTKRHVLEQALTDESVYTYPEFKNVGNYQILEFIGDAIFELVICEYLYWHFVNDAGGAYFNRKTIVQFTSGKFQVLMALSCGIMTFLRVPPSVKIKNVQDFMEAVIGALYVDTRRERSITFVKEYLYNYCYRINCHAAVILDYELPVSLRKCLVFDPEETAEKLQCSAYHSANIVNLEAFLSKWEDFTTTQKQHMQNFRAALQSEKNIRTGHYENTLQELKKKVDETDLPEYCCNQLEFERVNVYRIAARIYLQREQEDSRKELNESGAGTGTRTKFCCIKYLLLAIFVVVISYFVNMLIKTQGDE